MDFVLVQTGTGCEAVPGGDAAATETRQHPRSPPRNATQSHERRPFGGTGDNHARIMQELRHRMQDLKRRLADRERDQHTPEQSHSRSHSRSRSRRTPSPQAESESTGERGRARRRHDPVIYARRERRRTTNRGDEDTRRENDEGRTTGTRGPVIMGATPFHRSILEVRLPKHFDKPTDMRYDGMQDPLEHLTAFEARMNLEGVGDEVRCRAFPVTLAGPAIRWFNNLPQGLVIHFSDISHAFLAQFTTRIAKAKHPINLLGVTQRAGEPTKKYLDRFNDKCLKIDGLTDSVVSLCLTNGLLNEDFRKHLTTKPVWTMQEIQCVAKEYINDEEVSRVVAANKRQPPTAKPATMRVEKDKRNTPGTAVRVRRQSHFPESGNSPTTPPHGTNHGRIRAQDPRLFRPEGCPGASNQGWKACRILSPHKGAEETESRSRRRGQIPGDKTTPRTRGRRPRSHGGERGNSEEFRPEVEIGTKERRQSPGCLLLIREKFPGTPIHLLRPRGPMIRRGTRKPPMVITARVETGLVKRILVDTGADSNIMFRNVFDALGLRDADLATRQHGVVGLGDHFIKLDRIISLPTSMGQGERRRTVMADFVVLRDSTAYNIILGRKTINDLGAAISTKLLVMKFVTDDRSMGSIRGDIETAVACDHASLSLRKKSKEA
ncbi:uncharacterized protein [Arachis hypogaea]|uniref:uncharacterized protein n=1 Tax=Arachis hypogaea TaxID=3818 RepID=UPI000DEC9190|nr:uncharacterized protein LOC112742350 [Arachis hypogaea]